MSRQGAIHKWHPDRGIHKCPFWDLMVVSWGHRKKKCIPMAEKWVVFAQKNLRHTFHSSRQPFLSSIWTVQPRYARFDNCPISEWKVLSQNEKFAFEFFPFSVPSFQPYGTYRMSIQCPTNFEGSNGGVRGIHFWPHSLWLLSGTVPIAPTYKKSIFVKNNFFF